jgi:hypothetical protein
MYVTWVMCTLTQIESAPVNICVHSGRVTGTGLVGEVGSKLLPIITDYAHPPTLFPGSVA